MYCPYCEYGIVLRAHLQINEESIYICEECDTVWRNEVDNKNGTSFKSFMKEKGLEPSWENIIVEQGEDGTDEGTGDGSLSHYENSN